MIRDGSWEVPSGSIEVEGGFERFWVVFTVVERDCRWFLGILGWF